jgi:hypothetical protein
MVVALAVIAAIGSPVRPLGQTWAIRVSRPLGVATVLTILAATVATALARGPKPRWRLTHRRKVALFFLSWLLIEGAAYMAMTPFPAARRAIGLSVVLTLLAGRLARRPRRPAVPIALPVAFGIALGVFYYAADLAEAVAQKAAAERSARWVRDQGSGHAWFVGHWGFQYYAEHSGLHPMVPGASRLRAGDWVVVPDKPIDVQASEYPPEDFRASCRIVAGDSLGFRTVINYYSAVVPLAGGARPRAATTIYRVERDLVPVDSKPDDG